MSTGVEIYTAAVQTLAAVGTIAAAVAAWKSASAASRTASNADRTARRATEALGRSIRPFLALSLVTDEVNRGPGPVQPRVSINNQSDWEAGAWTLEITAVGSALQAQVLTGDSVPPAGMGPISREVGPVSRVAPHPPEPGTTGDRPEDRRTLASWTLRYRDGRGAVEWSTAGEFVERQLPPDPEQVVDVHRPHYLYETRVTQEAYPDTGEGVVASSEPRPGPLTWKRGGMWG